MKIRYVLVALLATSPTQAADLLCDGKAFVRRGESYERSVLVSLNQADDSIRINTANGWAKGNLGSDPQTYKGNLLTPSGTRYWYNLDRYTGEVMWTVSDSPVVEFMGFCKPAKPIL